jgi:hypothetical protein
MFLHKKRKPPASFVFDKLRKIEQQKSFNPDVPVFFNVTHRPTFIENNVVEDRIVEHSILKDILNGNPDRESIERANFIINEAAVRLSERLGNTHKLILFCLINIPDKSDLGPLKLANYWNYIIKRDGTIGKMQTKAWDDSRMEIEYIKNELVREIFEVIREHDRENRLW